MVGLQGARARTTQPASAAGGYPIIEQEVFPKMGQAKSQRKRKSGDGSEKLLKKSGRAHWPLL